jgi:hypothetical protein
MEIEMAMLMVDLKMDMEMKDLKIQMEMKNSILEKEYIDCGIAELYSIVDRLANTNTNEDEANLTFGEKEEEDEEEEGRIHSEKDILEALKDVLDREMRHLLLQHNFEVVPNCGREVMIQLFVVEDLEPRRSYLIKKCHADVDPLTVERHLLTRRKKQ